MAKLEWNENLSVGVELIDAQHKTWIDRYNNVVAAVAARQGPAELGKTLEFLIDYTETHFSTEEKNMAAGNYPGLVDHKAKHDELRGTLADLTRDFREEGATHMVSDALDTFLGNWLIDHIKSTDMKFGAFVKEQGLTVEE